MPSPEGSILVVEPARRVFNAVASAADSLSARGGPGIEARLCESSAPVDVTRALQGLPTPAIVVVVQPPGQASLVAHTVRTLSDCLKDSVPLAVAPDPGGVNLTGIGWIPSCSGIAQLLWLARGARAIVTQQELGSPTVCRKLMGDLPGLRRGVGVVLGREPVEGLDSLHTEVSDIWHELDDERVCWRAAFALSYCAPLMQGLNEWTRIAHHLIQSVPWFKYNHDDVRKALGRLGEAWGYTYRPIRHQIAAEARVRGYLPDLPNPGPDIEDLFEAAMDLDVSGRKKFSGAGIECDELTIHVA